MTVRFEGRGLGLTARSTIIGAVSAVEISASIFFRINDESEQAVNRRDLERGGGRKWKIMTTEQNDRR